MAYRETLPGKGPMLHNHDTNESMDELERKGIWPPRRGKR